MASGIGLLERWPSSAITLFQDDLANDCGSDIDSRIKRLRSFVRRQSTFGRAGELLALSVEGVRNNAVTTTLADGLGYMTARQLEAASSVPRSSIARLHDAKMLDGVTVRTTSDRSNVLYPSEVAERVRRAVAGRQTTRDAKNGVGVSLQTIDALVATGDLELEGGVLRHIYPGDTHVTPASLAALQARLKAATRPAREGEKTIPLWNAFRTLPAPSKPWMAIIRAVLDGEFELIGGGHTSVLRLAHVPHAAVPLLATLSLEAEAVDHEFVDEADARERMNCNSKQLRLLMAEAS